MFIRARKRDCASYRIAIYHKSISLPISRDYQRNLLASLNVTFERWLQSMAICRNSIFRLSEAIFRKITSHRANIRKFRKIDRKRVAATLGAHFDNFSPATIERTRNTREERRDRDKIAECAREDERGACSIRPDVEY